MKSSLAVLTLMLTLSTVSNAALIGNFVPITNEAGFTPPTGFVSQSLVVDTTTDWLAANLIVTLDDGSFYQDALLSGFGPPSSILVNALPSTRWDTYVTGSLGLNGGSPSSTGGAVDLGGTPAGTFSTSHVDLNWFTTTTNDIGNFSIGRFTLSNDAEGTFSLRLDSLSQSAPFLLTGVVHKGYLSVVPEVSTSLLTGIALAVFGLVIGLRRSFSNQSV